MIKAEPIPITDELLINVFIPQINNMDKETFINYAKRTFAYKNTLNVVLENAIKNRMQIENIKMEDLQ